MRLLSAATRVAAIAALWLAACASDDSIPVSTNYDPLFRFPATASYAWDDATSSLPDVEAVDPEATRALLKDVANEAFAARGYRAVTGSSDFKLSFQYMIRTFTGTDVSTATGSISLLMLERSSGRRVWLGFGQAEVHVGLSPEERRARLRDAMARMLQNFPPSQRPAD